MIWGAADVYVVGVSDAHVHRNQRHAVAVNAAINLSITRAGHRGWSCATFAAAGIIGAFAGRFSENARWHGCSRVALLMLVIGFDGQDGSRVACPRSGRTGTNMPPSSGSACTGRCRDFSVSRRILDRAGIDAGDGIRSSMRQFVAGRVTPSLIQAASYAWSGLISWQLRIVHRGVSSAD